MQSISSLACIKQGQGKLSSIWSPRRGALGRVRSKVGAKRVVQSDQDKYVSLLKSSRPVMFIVLYFRVVSWLSNTLCKLNLCCCVP